MSGVGAASADSVPPNAPRACGVVLSLASRRSLARGAVACREDCEEVEEPSAARGAGEDCGDCDGGDDIDGGGDFDGCDDCNGCEPREDFADCADLAPGMAPGDKMSTCPTANL